MTQNEKDGYQKLWKYAGYYLGECKKKTSMFIHSLHNYNSITICISSVAFDCKQ